MKMNILTVLGTALGATLFLAVQTNAGGMPPEYEIDANGVPVDGIEPVAAVSGPTEPLDEPATTLITAAVDDPQFATTAMPIETPLVMATATFDPAKDHR